MEVIGAHRRIPVTESSQPAAARFAVRDAADRAGFNEEDGYRAGLVATELATNLVKHATAGEVLVREVRAGGDGEVEILAIDRGPGIADPSRWLTDGYSTAGTSGTGLGAVKRLADDFDLYSQAGRGTIVFARICAKRRSTRVSAPIHLAGISVPKSGEDVCGDGWRSYPVRDGALVVVVDGLGHGIQANEAAAAALAVVDPTTGADLPNLLQVMHEGLRHTRGAAGAIARIHFGLRVLKYAGIGNISGSIYQPAGIRHAVSMNGTLGHEARAFREYSYPWEPDATFIMHSDGLTSHWSLGDYPGLTRRHPAVVAAVLYRDFSRHRDDVTVVVGREAA